MKNWTCPACGYTHNMQKRLLPVLFGRWHCKQISEKGCNTEVPDEIHWYCEKRSYHAANARFKGLKYWHK